jgi:hypothetical protein
VRLEPRSEGQVTPEVALIEAFRAVRRARVLWLSLDDMDWVSGDALSLLKSAMEAVSRPATVVCVAGGPDVRRRLVSEHSPIIRFFTGSDFDLSNFTAQETREALDLPLVENGISARWANDAVAAVHRWTGGYPYLTQCLAHAAFVPGLIGPRHVEEALPAALRSAGLWMDQELATASDMDLRLLDRLGGANRSVWRATDLHRVGVPAEYIRRLVRLGALHKVSRGQYLLAKPPMIARYHLRKRGLEKPGADGAAAVAPAAPNP